MDDDAPPATCRLCGAPLPEEGGRCPACGLAVARNVSGAAIRRLVAGLLALYLFTAVVLMLTR
jgi:predicted amidophosphoribosyltransferase